MMGRLPIAFCIFCILAGAAHPLDSRYIDSIHTDGHSPFILFSLSDKALRNLYLDDWTATIEQDGKIVRIVRCRSIDHNLSMKRELDMDRFYWWFVFPISLNGVSHQENFSVTIMNENREDLEWRYEFSEYGTRKSVIDKVDYSNESSREFIARRVRKSWKNFFRNFRFPARYLLLHHANR